MSDHTALRAVALATSVRGQDNATAKQILADLTPQHLRSLATHLAKFASLAALIEATPEADEEHVHNAVTLAARRFDVRVQDVFSESRRQPVMEARQVACYAVRHATGMSYTRIGLYLGRDHTTVMYSVTRVGETPRLRGIANEIAGQLGWDRNQSEAS